MRIRGPSALGIGLGPVQEEVDALNPADEITEPVAHVVIGTVTGERHDTVLDFDCDLANAETWAGAFPAFCG